MRGELLVLIVILSAFVYAQVCEAPNGYDCWYVATNGSDLSGNGSFVYPYLTINHTINQISGGDHVYIRNGTYLEKWLNFPNLLSGTAASSTTIKSYPGEWARVDGQHDCFSTTGIGRDAAAIFILQGGTEYVTFENLEITGGGYPGGYSSGGDGTSGIRAWDATRYITIKNCYIHNNTAGDGGGNPGGIYAKTPQNWTISYNYFENNGCPPDVDISNCIGSLMAIGERNLFTESNAMRNNEFSYNIVDGGKMGIRHKHVQFFGPLSYDNENYTYKDWGDKVHHNIFRPFGATAIFFRQDFVNVYNNILDFSNATSTGFGGGGLHIQDYGGAVGDDQKVHKYLFYNNLIINPLYGGITLAGYSDPHSWIYNNIIENNDNFWMNAENRDINIQNSAQNEEVNLTNCFIDRNYIFRPQDSNHYLLSGTPEKISTITFNSMYSTMNYVNSTASRSSLYLGTTSADKYKLISGHKVNATATIADAGLGGNHPYLEGMQIPEYLGAVNPDDNDWVEGVLSLSNTSVLMNMNTSIPDWVEGAVVGDSCHDADLDCDSTINTTEIREFVGLWKSRSVIITDLFSAIDSWKR